MSGATYKELKTIQEALNAIQSCLPWVGSLRGMRKERFDAAHQDLMDQIKILVILCDEKEEYQRETKANSITLSEEAKRVLDLAEDERRLLKHKHLGPEHILMGLLRFDIVMASRVLRADKLDLHKVRADIIADRIKGGI